MSFRWMTLGLIAASSAAAVTAVTTLSSNHLHPRLAAGKAPLHAYGSRSAAQRRDPSAAKFDATLAELVRSAPHASAAHPLADLHSLSPGARFKLAADGVTPLVAIDAVTVGNPQQLTTALAALGMEHIAVFANDVGGWLPINELSAAAARGEVHAMRAAMSRTRSGPVATQGDYVQESAAVRSTDGVTGAGITVGVLSDSFNCYAVYAVPANGVPSGMGNYAGYDFNGFTADAETDEADGALPATVDVLEEASCLDYDQPLQAPFTDEGRAMLQIVHEVAPGAGLEFYTAENSEADFANGIVALANAGASVIADDVGYFDEPFYQDGIVAQAIDTVEAAGVAYFSAAGNDANSAYENTAPTFSTAGTGENANEYLLNFDTSGATTTTALPVTIDALQPGELAAIVVEWDQPYVTGAPNSGGATSELDLCVTGATGYTIQNGLSDSNADVTCTGPNATGSDPVQVLIIANPANATASTAQQTISVVVGLAGGTKAPGRVKVAVLTDGQSDPPLTAFATPNAANSATIQGHPGAAGAMAIGAAFYFDTPACGTTPATLESYSSEGGAPILFDSSGTRLATPVTRQKPDVVGPDGTNDTFLGFELTAADGASNGLLPTSISECQNAPSYPNFFGTSAATPHVASIAALMLEANSSLTPTAIYTALRSSALTMSGSVPDPSSGVFNFNTGYGFVQANAAFGLIPPGAPTLSGSAGSVTSGTSLTLTWSSVNATSCTASGDWSGTLAGSGTQVETPTTVGTATYDLTCSNAAGTSAAATVSVTVTAPPGKSGGGALDIFTLLALTALALRSAGRIDLKSTRTPNRRAR